MPQLSIKQRYAQLDAAGRRRWRRDYMPPAKAQDARDLAVAIDQGHYGHTWPALRDALLQRAVVAWGAEYTLHPAQLEELEHYLETGDAFPLWAQAISGEDQNARRLARALNGGVAVEAAPSRGPDPDEPNRFQPARDRFAQPGDPLFSPDSR